MSQLIALTADQHNWQTSYQCANFLLKEGMTIHWATEPFKAVTPSGESKVLERGTFLITGAPEDSPVDWLQVAQKRFEAAFLETELPA